MNFLAHIYLSNNNDDLIIGNFIADFITGNNYKHLPPKIQNGIFLHRKIDSFTDAHTIVRKSKRRLHQRYGHYDGIIIDILFDHFLAKNWEEYSTTSLVKTEKNFIQLIKEHSTILPEKVNQIIPYLEKQKWLSNYATFDGIERTLIGVDKRTNNKSKMNLAIEDLHQNYNELHADFTIFFKELKAYVKNEIQLNNYED